MFWTAQNVRRIIIDFIQKIAPDLPLRGNSSYFTLNDLQNDFGLSSMQIVDLTAQINSFFHLFDLNKPPNLLRNPFVNIWVNEILHARNEKDEYISFKSSGTSGNAHLITHSVESLNYEISFLKKIIQKPNRVISFVPSNHIYGFLFTIGLPNSWNIPVTIVNQIDNFQFDQSDLIVATPFNWHFISQSLNLKKIHVHGVSSGAPLHNQLFESLAKSGFKLTEVYGSTETGGVGWRDAPNAVFKLFPYWEFDDKDKLFRKYDHREFKLMDHIVQLVDNHFTIQSRVDQMVQVGGVNINLDHIKRKIESITNIKKAAIYAKAEWSGTLITASIELFNSSETDKENCIDEIYKRLDLVEVPKHIVFINH